MMIYIFIYFSGHVAFSPGIPQLHLKVLNPFIVKMDYTDDSLPHVSKHLGADHVWSWTLWKSQGHRTMLAFYINSPVTQQTNDHSRVLLMWGAEHTFRLSTNNVMQHWLTPTSSGIFGFH